MKPWPIGHYPLAQAVEACIESPKDLSLSTFAWALDDYRKLVQGIPHALTWNGVFVASLEFLK